MDVSKLTPSMRLWIAVLALTLTSCSWIGDEPTEAERAAAELRSPPDVLTQANARRLAENSEPADGNDRIVTEPARTSSTNPESLLVMVDGAPALDLGLPIEASWAIVGRALERSGFALLASERDAGSHRIRYDSSVAGEIVDEGDSNRGVLSGLNFFRDEPELGLTEFAIIVTERGKGSRVQLQTLAGEPAPRGAAQQVLTVLAEQLKP